MDILVKAVGVFVIAFGILVQYKPFAEGIDRWIRKTDPEFYRKFRGTLLTEKKIGGIGAIIAGTIMLIFS